MWSPAGERRAARRRRLRADRYRLPDPADYRWTGPVGVHVPTMETFVEQVERGGWDTADLVALRLEAERLSALADYDELLAVDVCDKPFDLVIVDEAHRLAGKGATKTRALVKRLGQDARYLLFLTATPVQNELLDLYRLVELLRPGTFRTEREFIARYVDTASSRRPVRADELRRPRAPFVQPRSTHETRSGGRWQRSATSQATSG